MSRFGTPGQNINPLAYTDTRISNVPCVEASRIPTASDKNYPLWTEWRISKNPASGTVGDFYKLVDVTGGSAVWRKISIDNVTTTKGDLIVRDASTNVRLPVGTNGQVLTADSTDAEGMVWATPAGGIGSETSWTPVLEFGGGSTGITYLLQTGSYMTIGDAVYFTFIIFLSSKGTDTGTALITGLPSTATSTSIIPVSVSSVTYAETIMGRVQSGTSSLSLDELLSGMTRNDIDNTEFANNSIVEGSGMYFV